MLAQQDAKLIDAVTGFYDDPLGFVLFAYSWGRKGPLQAFDGPDLWQREFLNQLGQEIKTRGFDGTRPVLPIRMTRASGHGIGKSAVVAWIVDFLMSTRPNAQGTVSANTSPQLQNKTWAQIKKWTALCITTEWFEINSSKMYHKKFESTWFCAPQTCKEENSEAFAGQHAIDSTSFYLFDEASAIPDKIFEVAEGGLTDGEPMMFAFGNPTRAEGKFFRINFGSERNRWNCLSIDSRSCKFPNHELHNEWIEDYGLDSDLVRVKVLGMPPRASSLQFIDLGRVLEAQRRQVRPLQDDPLIMGIDVARGGADFNVIRFRRGVDARSIAPIRIPGEQTRDTSLLVTKIADLIAQHRPAAVFLDATGIGGPIGDRLRQLGHRVIDVQFGGGSPDPKYENMRAFMWGKMKGWLMTGAIEDGKTTGGRRLETDLTSPNYAHNKKDKLVLESKESMKERGLDSPDDGDALALTFAQSVAPRKRYEPTRSSFSSVWS
jgi:hypothetical protein